MNTSGFSIIRKLNSGHVDQLLALSKKMWWATDRSKEELALLLKNSLPFALIENGTQNLVGFARVLTDEVHFGYIYDVMLEEHLRGKGLGKMMINAILSHEKFARVKFFELTCAPDMTDYYASFGFSTDYGRVVAMRLNHAK